MKEKLINKEKRDLLLYLFFAFLAVYAIRLHYGMRTSDFLLLPLFLALAYFYTKQKLFVLLHKEKKIVIGVAILALLFGFFQTLGAYEVYYHQRILVSLRRILLSIIAWFFFFWNLLVLAYHWLDSIEFKPTQNKNYKYLYIGLVGLLFVLWLPYLLNYFPGTTTWDVEYQLTQVIGARPITKAHPIFHTLFIKFFYDLSLTIFQNANIALATVTIAQMLILSSIYSYVIYYLYKNNFPRVIWIGTFLFYGGFALNAAHTVILWKDILFSAVFLLFSLFLWKARDIDFKDKRSSTLYFLKLGLTAIFLCLMRNNGIYVFIGLIPFMLYFYRKNLLPIIVIISLTLVVQSGVQRFLHQRYEVIDSYANDMIELLSIPIQQVARVVVEDGNIDNDSMNQIKEVTTVEEVKANYNPVLSDPMKVLLRNSEHIDHFNNNLDDYFSLWLRLGVKNPDLYMKAYIEQTRGYWYPDIQGPVIRMDSAGKEASLDTYQVNLLGEGFSSLMYSYNFAYLELPLLGIFYSLAAYIWLALLVLFFLFLRRTSFLGAIPAVLLWGILLVSTPVASEFRYAYPIVISAPLYVAMLVDSFQSNRKQEVTKISERV